MASTVPSDGRTGAQARFALFSVPALRVAMVPVALAIVIAGGLAGSKRLKVTGDEPHYLALADAIAHDRTFDVRDAYTRESQTHRIYGSPLPAPHVVIVNHRWGPYHQPGLGVLLALPFALGGVMGARLALCVLAGVLPLCCAAWLRQRMPGAAAAWLTLGLTLCVPVLFGSSQIYPDLTAGAVALALTLWLMRSGPADVGRGSWAIFWLLAGGLALLNTKFLATTAALATSALIIAWKTEPERRGSLRPAIETIALVAIGPLLLAAFHAWAFGTVLGARGVAELTNSPARATSMLLGLHLDQGQGMFFQQPLLLAGVAALVPFVRRRPLVGLCWFMIYLSLIVPNSLELARYGGGGPAGRFGWSAAWLWIVPIGFVLDDYGAALQRWVTPIVAACLAYQLLLAARWLPRPGVLFPNLDERLAVRNSLFPVAIRPWLPSFYFWDFSSHWTYLPNVAAYVGLALLLAAGARLAASTTSAVRNHM